MSQSTVKIKHLGLFSTGKFMAVFTLILNLVLLGVGAATFIVYIVFALLAGLLSGSYDVLAGSLVVGGVSLVTFLVSAAVGLIASVIVGFFAGMIVAFAFNVVVKLSGGLAFDADVESRG